nr:endo-1,4-beta-D-glucanase [uncultured bacterium]
MLITNKKIMLPGLGKALALAGVSSLLLACGGGGGSNSGSTPGSKSAASSKAVSSVVVSSAGVSSAASSSAAPKLIKVNQLGFLPDSTKLSLVPDVPAPRFQVIQVDTDQEVLSGDLTAATRWEPASDSVKLADFSSLNAPGDYLIRVEGLPDSHPFTIAENAYESLLAASIKAFYFSRSGTELLEEHAGKFARPLGHADSNVLIHESAASAARPAGTPISSPKGWYDAGDYNKYIVNSGISTYTLLATYEHFPELFADQNLAIPESTNSLPDLLDEIKWNLDWMLTMQDPADGGVYHKLTNKNFDGTVMPHQATSPRYVVQKTTAAALNFAAVMATASRVFAAQDETLAQQMLDAAEAAWAWAKANPSITYTQPADIKTGEYGDSNLADEFAWAAAELYITTKKDDYYTEIKPNQTYNTVPSWGDVRGLAWVSLAHHREQLTTAADKALIGTRIESLANNLLSVWKLSPYKITMQNSDFVWGSNAVVLNQAMMLVQAYRLNGKREFLDAAQSQLDYVLGRNAVDTSFVTGFGHKSPLHPHHRPSEADGIAEPIPGYVVGGPQPGQQDKADCPLAYPSNITAKSYLDHYCSYASNEIAINWNAPLVYVTAAIQALTK